MRPRLICTLALVFACLTRLPAAADTTPSLDQLNVYNGTWDVKAHYENTALSQAHDEHAIVQVACWHSSAFFTCNQSRISKPPALTVYSLDPRTHIFSVYLINPGQRRPPTGMSMNMSGNTWTYFTSATDRSGKRLLLRTIHDFSGNDAFDFEEDFSRDGAHWTIMSSGHEKRLHS